MGDEAISVLGRLERDSRLAGIAAGGSVKTVSRVGWLSSALRSLEFAGVGGKCGRGMFSSMWGGRSNDTVGRSHC